MTLQERFEAKVFREPNSGCYLWTAAVGKGGYGHFGVGGKVRDTHRLAYEMYVASIPSGSYVLHKCDVKCCVNPQHLFLGTQSDNLNDMTKKGRRNSARGEKSGAAKLTEKQVLQIRSDKRSTRTIAPEYGVGKSTIAAVKAGTSWRTA